MRFKVILVFCLVLVSSIAGKSQEIIYDFPESVTKKITTYISNFSDTVKFAIQLNAIELNKYVASVMSEDRSNSEGSKLISEMLINKTNRFVRVGDRLLPLITAEDFVFAYLGSGGTRKGKVGRKKVIQNFDGYSITFDTTGRIY